MPVRHRRVVRTVGQHTPEYVYALFDFVPQNPDEIHLKTGDRIEVLEKDEEYNDGWWEVSSLPSAEVTSFRSMSGLCFGLGLWRSQIHGEEACCGYLERVLFRILFHRSSTSVC